MQILLGIMHGLVYAQGCIAFVKEETDKSILTAQNYPPGCHPYDQYYPNLRPDSALYPFHIAFSAELREKDPRSCQTSENGKRHNEIKLVHYGNSGHLLRSHLADHQIVQQVYEVCYDVLDHYRYRYRKCSFVKGFIADQRSRFFHFHDVREYIIIIYCGQQNFLDLLLP